MTDKKVILKDLKNTLEIEYHGNVLDVILFGSQANEQANEGSDYDILIILQNKYRDKDEDEILNICYSIDLKYNILIDAHILSSDELLSLRGKQPVFVNAINKGIYA
jgi:predicted nucleotidyltransferase